jgi:hypothetical protein
MPTGRAKLSFESGRWFGTEDIPGEGVGHGLSVVTLAVSSPSTSKVQLLEAGTTTSTPRSSRSRSLHVCVCVKACVRPYAGWNRSLKVEVVTEVHRRHHRRKPDIPSLGMVIRAGQPRRLPSSTPSCRWRTCSARNTLRSSSSGGMIQFAHARASPARTSLTDQKKMQLNRRGNYAPLFTHNTKGNIMKTGKVRTQ